MSLLDILRLSLKWLYYSVPIGHTEALLEMAVLQCPYWTYRGSPRNGCTTVSLLDILRLSLKWLYSSVPIGHTEALLEMAVLQWPYWTY